MALSMAALLFAIIIGTSRKYPILKDEATAEMHTKRPAFPPISDECAKGGFKPGPDCGGVSWENFISGFSSSNVFFSTAYEGEKASIKRQTANHYGGLRQDLENVYELIDAIEEAKKHDKYGLGKQVGCTQVKQGDDDKSDINESIFKAYLDGHTIICSLIGVASAPLARSLLDAMRVTGMSWSANMYLTPRASRGFLLHNDCKDVLIAQLDGKKEWECHGTNFSRPDRGQEVGGKNLNPVSTHIGKLQWKAQLRTGDLLHIPRGVIHAGFTTSEAASLHFTVGPLQTPQYNTMIQAAVEMIINHPETSKMDEQDVQNFYGFYKAVMSKAIPHEMSLPENGWLRAALPPLWYATATSSAGPKLSMVAAETYRKVTPWRKCTWTRISPVLYV